MKMYEYNAHKRGKYLNIHFMADPVLAGDGLKWKRVKKRRECFEQMCKRAASWKCV